MNTHPEKWYIQLTPENYDEVKAWWLKQVEKSGWSGRLFRESFIVLSVHPKDDSYYWSGDEEYFIKQYPSYQKITLEQFRAITNPKPMNTHPEKWYIVATEDNYDELEAWRQTVSSYLDSFRIGYPLLSHHPIDNSYYYGGSVDSLRCSSDFNDYQEITIEQFRAITNTKPMSKTEVKTIQISRTLLNEYYDAATTPQREYLTKHFKLDGTTTDEAIRGLYELACGGWKPKIKANHPECFPEESKYFDFSKHTNQYGYDSIVSSDVADSLGLCRDFIQVRISTTKNDSRAFYLTDDYNWELVKEGGAMTLIPTKKVK